MRGFRTALGLLTRLPVGMGSGGIGPALAWFPLVGLLVGGAVAASHRALLMAAPPWLAAALAVGVGIVLTGALHEDGLGDVADAAGAMGGDEARLEALRDPSLGTFGVTAVVFSVLLRTAALASLGQAAWPVILAAHVLGRTAAGWMTLVPSSRPAGLGASLAGSTGRSSLAVATALGLVVTGLFLGWWGAGAVAIALMAAVTLGRWAIRRLGGMSGDVMGTVEQVTEIGTFCVGAIGQPWSWWG